MKFLVTTSVALMMGGTAFAQESLDQGLVLHYPFNGDANDHSPSANHASAYNGAVLTRDRFGSLNNAIHLNGSGAFLQSANPLPELDSITVSIWFALDAWMPSFGAPQVIFFEGDDGGGRDLAGYLMAGVHISNKADLTTRHENWMPPLRAWTHLVYVADSTSQTSTIWINGTLVAQEFYPGGVNVGHHSPFNLGRRPGGYNDWFMAGQIDDVRIYDRPLSTGEITSLHNLERGAIKHMEIAVEQLRLTLNVTPGKTYLLQSSNDLMSWRNYGEAFTPTIARIQTSVALTEVGSFFRLVERP